MPSDINPLITEYERRLNEVRTQRDALRKAIQKIELAIIEEGKMPSYHNAVMKRHREEWGTLHKAIDDAIDTLHNN